MTLHDHSTFTAKVVGCDPAKVRCIWLHKYACIRSSCSADRAQLTPVQAFEQLHVLLLLMHVVLRT